MKERDGLEVIVLTQLGYASVWAMPSNIMSGISFGHGYVET